MAIDNDISRPLKYLGQNATAFTIQATLCMNQKPSLSRGIQSVEVGCRILEALVDAGEPMMLRDLAARAGLAPAQAHAYLVSFRRTHLVEQDAAAGTYSIGPFSLKLAQSRMSTLEHMTASIASAAALSSELGLMAAVVVWSRGGPTVVHVQEGAHTLNVNLRSGTTLPITRSASGYVFAAFGGMPDLDSLIGGELAGASPDLVPAPAMDQAGFRTVLAGVVEAGYGVTQDQPVPGICTVAAPVFDHHGRIAVAMTLVGPTHVVKTQPKSAVVSRLLEACSRISAGTVGIN